VVRFGLICLDLGKIKAKFEQKYGEIGAKMIRFEQIWLDLVNNKICITISYGSNNLEPIAAGKFYVANHFTIFELTNRRFDFILAWIYIYCKRPSVKLCFLSYFESYYYNSVTDYFNFTDLLQ